MKDKKIIVLMGGPSKEAEVSRRTGAAIAEALESKGYNAQTLELNPRTVLMQFTVAMVKMVHYKAYLKWQKFHILDRASWLMR